MNSCLCIFSSLNLLLSGTDCGTPVEALQGPDVEKLLRECSTSTKPQTHPTSTPETSVTEKQPSTTLKEQDPKIPDSNSSNVLNFNLFVTFLSVFVFIGL
jgi:hypothetical protein